MRFLSLVSCALLGLSVTVGVGARRITKDEVRTRQHEAAKRWAPELRARANSIRPSTIPEYEPPKKRVIIPHLLLSTRL